MSAESRRGWPPKGPLERQLEALLKAAERAIDLQARQIELLTAQKLIGSWIFPVMFRREAFGAYHRIFQDVQLLSNNTPTATPHNAAWCCHLKARRARTYSSVIGTTSTTNA